MKNPEDIKKGLKCMRGDRVRCPECAYYEKIHTLCTAEIAEDALAYIQCLENELARSGLARLSLCKTVIDSSKKRNQAVEDIRMLGRTGEFICPACAYYNHGEGTKGECVKCLTGDGFRWRGEKYDVE